MMSAFGELKLQMNELGRTSDQHSVTLHQTMGLLQQLQQNQEQQEFRVAQIEAQKFEK